MMKMILADDEPVITKGIQKLVDWKSLGIEIIGVYDDGKSALQGIMQLKPDLALLDISMPGMSGVEILKECSALQLATNIIFISGFQDFQYAKDALKYGAMEYLLKPVIRDELIAAVEKCTRQNNEYEMQEKQKESQDIDYSKLIEIEDTDYLTVYADIIYPQDMNEQMKKLIHFSFISFLEEYLDCKKVGITFTRKNHVAVILKGLSREESQLVVEELWKDSETATGQKTVFIMGRTVNSMSEIPSAFEECLAMSGYQFFADQMEIPIMEVGTNVFRMEQDQDNFTGKREELINAMIAQDTENFEKSYQWLGKIICRLAEGKKEDACYYFYNTAKQIEEKFKTLGVTEINVNMKECLEKGRNTTCYSQMLIIYHDLFTSYMTQMQTKAIGSDKQSFLQAKEYIEQHFDENITLQIMADQIHMNPYYFSSFFKKNAGVNFKDYLSKIRIDHAVKLLISTNKKTYEIAMDVGFSDARTFSEVFQRYYHETPNGYRKRIIGK